MANSGCASEAGGGKLSPQRFEAVLSSISDGVFSIDPTGRITCFNRAAEQIPVSISTSLFRFIIEPVYPS